MRLRRPFAVVILVAAAISNAGAEGAILEPCRTTTAGYRSEVQRLLGGNKTGETVDLSAFVYPAFAPEWSIAVVETASGSKVVRSEFAGSYWASGWRRAGDNGRLWDPSIAHGEATTRDRPISQALARTLRQAWEISLSRLEDRRVLGFDGITYQFKTASGKCGETWSPELAAMSMPDQLARLAFELKILAGMRVEPDATEREHKILELATTFVREFGGPGPKSGRKRQLDRALRN